MRNKARALLLAGWAGSPWRRCRREPRISRRTFAGGRPVAGRRRAGRCPRGAPAIARDRRRGRREGHLSAPVQAKLDSASAQAGRLSPLDERSRAAVDEAYTALNGGRAFAFPPAVASIEQAKAYGRGQVDRSLAALSAGRSEEAVRELLGFVLLVITPMEAKG